MVVLAIALVLLIVVSITLVGLRKKRVAPKEMPLRHSILIVPHALDYQASG